jgi:hypothetical protein
MMSSRMDGDLGVCWSGVWEWVHGMGVSYAVVSLIHGEIVGSLSGLANIV